MEKKKSGGMDAVLAALAANVLVAISKFVGFAFSGSTAMLNESIHSVVDCSNQVLLLFGDKLAKREQSDLHQFGEARAKYFFSMLVATLLFFGGGALGVYEAINKILHPAHEVANHGLVIGILLFAILVESFSLRVAFKEINELNEEKLSLFKFLKESRHSEIIIVFIEDFCAIFGLLLALGATILAMITGNAIYDAIGGLFIGLLLMVAAIFLAKEFYSLIVGERVNEADLNKIKKAFARDDVQRIIDIKTVHLGPTEILIAAKIDLLDIKEDQGYDIINDIERNIRKEIADKKCYIYIELDKFVEDYKRI